MAKKRSRKKERKRASRGRRQQEHTTGFQRTTVDVPEGVEFFKFERKGSVRLDIIPFEAGEGNPYAAVGELYWERTYWVHRGIGPNNDSYVCPAKTAGKRCPICEYRDKLQRDPDADEQEIKDLNPKERQLFNVFDHDNPEEGVQIWDVSFYLFGRLLDAEIRNADEDENYDLFHDAEEGYTLKIGVSEESGGGYKFFAAETIGFKSRRDPIEDEVLDAAVCLDDVLIILPYDELRAIFLQEETVEEEEEELPKKKKKRKKKSAKKEPEPLSEFDDDDDDDWEDDDDKGELEIPDGHHVCKACGGTGEDSKGRTCSPCGGLGYLPDKEKKKSVKKKTVKKKKVPEPDDDDWDDDWDD